MESIAEIKSGLHHYIAETDDINLLSKIKKYVIELLQKENTILVHTSDGRALNQAEYKADIDRAIDEANRDDVVSIEEMEKHL